VDGLRGGVCGGPGGAGLHSGLGTEAGAGAGRRSGMVLDQDLECSGDAGLGQGWEDSVLRDLRMEHFGQGSVQSTFWIFVGLRGCGGHSVSCVSSFSSNSS
jgi:hypothetical protein